MFNNINLEFVNNSIRTMIVEFSKDHSISIEDTIWFIIDMELLSPY